MTELPNIRSGKLCIFILSSSLFLTTSSLSVPSFCSFISTFLSSFSPSFVTVLPATSLSISTLLSSFPPSVLTGFSATTLSISTVLSSFPPTAVAVLPATSFSFPTVSITVSVPVPTFSLTTEPLFTRTCSTVLFPSPSPLAGVVLAHVLSLTFLSTSSSFSEFSLSFSLPTATLPLPVSTATFMFSSMIPAATFKRSISFSIVTLTLSFLPTPPAV